MNICRECVALSLRTLAFEIKARSIFTSVSAIANKAISQKYKNILDTNLK